MKIETKTKKESMLPRTTYEMKATFTGATPSRADVKNKVSILLDEDPKNVVVRSMNPGFGRGTLTFKTRVYSDDDAKNLLESNGMLERNNVTAQEENTEEE